ncbi:MAG: chemotaxis response regulator protein-glutamate methylesterase [Planctomycetota bacterium]|nr:chemotaxis response regulator protein-glutamate methylesterase [Planctomycetota bacterium]
MSDRKRPIRVLVVDDSALVRKAISDCLARDPELEVVGTAPDPYVAREKIARLDPDVITLDLEMPRMDGLTFLRILMEHHPLPVVVVSSLAQAGSQAALDAVDAGAVDVLAKPDGTMSLGGIADRLAWHVKAAAAAGRHLRRRPAAIPPSSRPMPPTAAPGGRQLIVIGASTGGVGALRQLLPVLPPGLPPIAIVQHISASFSKAVADRLAETSALAVREAGHDEPLLPGECVIAPGGRHLAIEDRSGFRTRLVDSPPLHHCRPAVDVLFRSAAEAAGGDTLGVLLTGMGSDGALGLQAIRAAGGQTLAEDESSCVVFGMPRAAIDLGVVDRVVPLPGMAAAIVEAACRR